MGTSLKRILLGGILSTLFLVVLNILLVGDVSTLIKSGLGILLVGLIWTIVKRRHWKTTTVVFLFYVVSFGFLGPVPRLDILNETIRNLYFHVPMWFGMMILTCVSLVYSVKYLRTNDLKNDIVVAEIINSCVVIGILGLSTGMLWAQFTWGKFWSNDPKQMAAAIGLLLYAAMIVLRGSFDDDVQRAKISAIYNIFAFPTLVVLLVVLPRMSDKSLHPGAEGNPAFSTITDNGMRAVFYPAVIGWTLLGVWFADIRIRMRKIENKIYELD